MNSGCKISPPLFFGSAEHCQAMEIYYYTEPDDVRRSVQAANFTTYCFLYFAISARTVSRPVTMAMEPQIKYGSIATWK